MGYRGMGHMGNSSTGSMGYKGYVPHGHRSHGQWGTWAMGSMGHGAYEPWGHGPMGNLDIFAHNIISTGWILTKILLDIDINVFYLNTGRFFHNGFI